MNPAIRRPRCWRVLLAAMAVAAVGQSNPLPARAGMHTDGNILFSYSPLTLPGPPRVLAEYTRTGQLVQSFSTPYPQSPIPAIEFPRDVVVTPDGLAHVYNGTGDPFLSTLNPVDGSWTHRTHPGWSTVGTTTYGGIATSGQYIFATDNDTGQGEDNLMGVIRFDMANGTSLRFADTIEPIDLNMGLDGLLYAQYPGGSFSGADVEVYDPSTLTHIRHIFFGLEGQHSSIAVSGNGDIYLADTNGDIERRAPNGSLITRINVCSLAPNRCFLGDIDIAPDGTILAGSTRGRVFVTDLNLSNPHLFPATLPDAMMFVTFVPEPGSAVMSLLAITIAAFVRPSTGKRASKIRSVACS